MSQQSQRKNVLFEYRGQWIAREPGRDALYRFWHESGIRRTRRKSLRTTDVKEAEDALVRFVMLSDKKMPDRPLSAVLEAYFIERTDKRPSKRQARMAGRTLLKCWGEQIKAKDCDDAKQKQFAEWCIEKGYTLSYTSRNLSVLSGAIALAEIPIKVRFGPKKIVERWGLTPKKAPRRVFIPTDEQLAMFLAHETMSGKLFRYCAIAAMTGARPGAIIDLTPAQRDREISTLDFNPERRVQTKKYRPIVKLPPELSDLLDRWEAEMRIAVGLRMGVPPEQADISGERYCGWGRVSGMHEALKAHRASVGLPKLTGYSFRHKATTVLRRARIPEDEIAQQLGHRRPDVAITAGYGEWSPDYLAGAQAAFEAWWKGLAAKRLAPASGPALPQRSHKTPNPPALAVVRSGAKIA